MIEEMCKSCGGSGRVPISRFEGADPYDFATCPECFSRGTVPIEIELNKIIHGDCLEVMDNIRSGSVDMILCDLPYGSTQCAWDIIIPFESLWEQYKRIIKPNGVIALFGSEPFSSFLRTSNIKMFKYDWIWDKIKGTGFLNAKKQPIRNHEIVSVFYEKQCLYNPIKTNGHVNKKSYRRKHLQTDVYGEMNKKLPLRKHRKIPNQHFAIFNRYSK